MKFRDLKIGTKQILGFSSILFIMIGVNIFSIIGMASLKSEIDDFDKNWLPRAIAISEINYNSANLRKEQLQYAYAKKGDLKKEETELLINFIDKINENIDIYENIKLNFNEPGEYSLKEDSLYSSFQQKWENYLDLSFEFLELTNQNQYEKAMVLLNNRARDVFNDFSNDLSVLVEICEVNVLKSTEQAGQAYMGTRLITTILLIIAIVFSIFLTIFLVRLILIPVYRLEKAAKKVANGNLNTQVKITSKDELGVLSKSFNSMTFSLKTAKERESIQAERLKMQWEVLGETNQELEEKSNRLETQKRQTEKKNTQLEVALNKLKETQNQLVQSEKMASVGQLTAGIAHEINNPINFVSSNIKPLQRDLNDLLELLSLYNDSIEKMNLKEEFEMVEKFKNEIDYSFLLDEIQSLLNGIDEGAKRTTEIVRGLRNFSRLDEGDRKLADINQGIDSTLLMLRNQLKNRIEVKKNLGSLPLLSCYPGKLNQVFMNLINNASQAIEGAGTIFIETKAGVNIIIVSIKDTGSGMSDDVIRHIFEPFYTTKDVGKGTGLGLSITFGIVQEHNGTIEVISNPGQGTEFIIKLPMEN